MPGMRMRPSGSGKISIAGEYYAPPFWTRTRRTLPKRYSEKESDQRRTHVLLYTNFWYWIIIFYTNVAFLLQFAQGRENKSQINLLIRK